MDLADELLRLRERLAATPSPIQRMKLLARAWRTLRQLSPEDRRRLAAEVGTEGAQEVLEGLASRSERVTPAMLLTALEKLRGSDPRELSGILRDLKDPQRRIDGLRRGVDKLGSVLAEPKPPAEEAAEEEVEEMTPAEPPPERGDVAPQASTERVAVEQPPEPPPPQPLPAEDRVLAPEPEPAAPPSAPPPVEQPVPPEPPLPSPGAAQPRPSGSELLARVGRAPTLMRRLAEARSLLDGAGESSVDELRALLDLFPQDWAKRRILTGLLQRGVPRDLHQAIYLIEALESKTSRRWCVSVLLHGWELSEAERRALIERAGLAVVGRRRFGVRKASDRPRA